MALAAGKRRFVFPRSCASPICHPLATTPMQLSVIVPVYNEGAPLVDLLRSLNRALAIHCPGEFEVIIVDDGSDFPTKHVLRDLPPEFRVVSVQTRAGSGSARRLASAQACGRLSAWIDGDSTYTAEDLVMLASKIGDADQVIGWRSTDHGHWLWLRHIVKRCTCALASAIWLKRIRDLNSGLRVFQRASMQPWLHELPDGFSCTSTATLAALNRRQRVIFLPIAYHPRPLGTHSKFHPLYDTWRLLRVIARQARRRWMGSPQKRSAVVITPESAAHSKH